MVWKWLIKLLTPCWHDYVEVKPEKYDKFEYFNPLMRCTKCGSEYRDMKSFESPVKYESYL